MKKLLYVILIVLIALFGLTFSYKNQQIVEVTYYFGVHFRRELTVLLFVTFALGLGCGYLLTLLNVLAANRKLAKVKKDLRRLQQIQDRPPAQSEPSPAPTPAPTPVLHTLATPKT